MPKRKRGRPPGSRATTLSKVPESWVRRAVIAYVKLWEAQVRVIATARKSGLFELEHDKNAAELVYLIEHSARPGATLALKMAAKSLNVSEESLRAVYYGKRRKARSGA